jgi:hypothetical protein
MDTDASALMMRLASTCIDLPGSLLRIGGHPIPCHMGIHGPEMVKTCQDSLRWKRHSCSVQCHAYSCVGMQGFAGLL